MLKLNFGCADNFKEGFDNADIQEGADLVFDFDKFPYPIKNNIYDYIYGKNILEHLQFPTKALNELWRICKPHAIIEIEVPHYNSRSAYDDLEHHHYFSEYAFKRLVEDDMFIDKKKRFKIILLKAMPSKLGRGIPKLIRNQASLLFNGIHAWIHVKLEVIK